MYWENNAEDSKKETLCDYTRSKPAEEAHTHEYVRPKPAEEAHLDECMWSDSDEELCSDDYMWSDSDEETCSEESQEIKRTLSYKNLKELSDQRPYSEFHGPSGIPRFFKRYLNHVDPNWEDQREDAAPTATNHLECKQSKTPLRQEDIATQKVGERQERLDSKQVNTQHSKTPSVPSNSPTGSGCGSQPPEDGSDSEEESDNLEETSTSEATKKRTNTLHNQDEKLPSENIPLTIKKCTMEETLHALLRIKTPTKLTYQWYYHPLEGRTLKSHTTTLEEHERISVVAENRLLTSEYILKQKIHEIQRLISVQKKKLQDLSDPRTVREPEPNRQVEYLADEISHFYYSKNINWISGRDAYALNPPRKYTNYTKRYLRGAHQSSNDWQDKSRQVSSPYLLLNPRLLTISDTQAEGLYPKDRVDLEDLPVCTILHKDYRQHQRQLHLTEGTYTKTKTRHDRLLKAQLQKAQSATSLYEVYKLKCQNDTRLLTIAKIIKRLKNRDIEKTNQTARCLKNTKYNTKNSTQKFSLKTKNTHKRTPPHHPTKITNEATARYWRNVKKLKITGRVVSRIYRNRRKQITRKALKGAEPLYVFCKTIKNTQEDLPTQDRTLPEIEHFLFKKKNLRTGDAQNVVLSWRNLTDNRLVWQLPQSIIWKEVSRRGIIWREHHPRYLKLENNLPITKASFAKALEQINSLTQRVVQEETERLYLLEDGLRAIVKYFTLFRSYRQLSEQFGIINIAKYPEPLFADSNHQTKPITANTLEEDEDLEMLRIVNHLIYSTLKINERVIPVTNPTPESNAAILRALREDEPLFLSALPPRDWYCSALGDQIDQEEYDWIMHETQPLYHYLMKVPSIRKNLYEIKLMQVCRNWPPSEKFDLYHNQQGAIGISPGRSPDQKHHQPPISKISKQQELLLIRHWTLKSTKNFFGNTKNLIMWRRAGIIDSPTTSHAKTARTSQAKPRRYVPPKYMKRRWIYPLRDNQIVVLKLVMKLRPNRSFNVSSFFSGYAKRVHEYGGKGGTIKKSKRRTETNLIGKVTNVYVPTIDFATNLIVTMRYNKNYVYCYFLIKGLNNLTYHNLTPLNALLSQWPGGLVLLQLNINFWLHRPYRNTYRCIKKFKRKVRIGKRVIRDKRLWRET